MDHLDASHCFTSEMGYGPNAGRAHADPSLKEGAAKFGVHRVF
jgi:hypothetical protein